MKILEGAKPDVTKDQSAGNFSAQAVEEFGLKLRVGWEPLIKHGLGFINFRLGYRGLISVR